MRYINTEQYREIKNIPRGRLAARFMIYVGGIMIKGDQILLCKSTKTKYPGWQLPGGKVLWSEKIIETLEREILEETGYQAQADGIVGIYQRETGSEDEEYMRMIFHIKSFKKKSDFEIDPKIEQSKWFDIDEVLAGKIEIQSKQILKEIKEFKEGRVYPLEVLQMYKW